MVKMSIGAAMYSREGVYHARLRRLDTESSMDKRPSVLRPAGRLSIAETSFMGFVS